MTSVLLDPAKTQLPASHLYTGVAASHLGDVAAALVLTLISYGRLTVRELTQRSGLPAAQVRSALVSLIQLNCIRFWAEPGLDAVYYLFSAAGMAVLVHLGELITHIKTLYGAAEAEVVQNVIENGAVCVHELMATYGSAQEQHDKMAVLVQLYNHGWLRRHQRHDLCPPEDLWDKLYQETLKAMPRTATTSEIKRVAEAKEATRRKFHAALAAGQEPKDVFVVEHGVHRLRPGVCVAVNFQRYEKALRTRALVSLAASRLGLLTALVYRACCLLIEQKAPLLGHPDLEISGLVTDAEEEQMLLRSVENALVDSKATVFSMRDVCRALPANLDLRNSILTQNFVRPGKRSMPDGDGSAKKIKLEDGFAVPTENGAGVDEPDFEPPTGAALPELVTEHLRLLTASSVPFLVEVAPGLYTVPFLQLARAVKQYHHEALVKTTLGANALRVLKCVQTMRLVDEKAIANLVLLKEKTVKNEVYRLVTHGVLEIQEVPRSADRAALKTFYLFRHKPQPTYSYLSESLMFAMGQILSNVQTFKLEHRILLDKCEREDVKGHEDELLLDLELKALRDLRAREVANMVRFNRLKWLQFIFGVLK